MKLGNIFHEDGMERRAHKIGSLSYLPQFSRALISLDAWKAGLVCCIPFTEEADKAPHIAGDLYYHDIWVGWIYTESNNNSPAYQIVLKVDPTPAFIVCEFRKQESIKRASSHRMVLEVREGSTE